METAHLQKLNDAELAKLARGLYEDVMDCFRELASRGCAISLGSYKVVDFAQQEVKITKEQTL